MAMYALFTIMQKIHVRAATTTTTVIVYPNAVCRRLHSGGCSISIVS